MLGIGHDTHASQIANAGENVAPGLEQGSLILIVRPLRQLAAKAFDTFGAASDPCHNVSFLKLCLKQCDHEEDKLCQAIVGIRIFFTAFHDHFSVKRHDQSP
ncbi:hypothetical protein [Rhizobium ruizarguesonis]|uniref:hypothetical protein n=1 Tax=Rhizobium ruizarguesonis TaxID=2081791 RepID=UPI0037151F7A